MSDAPLDVRMKEEVFSIWKETLGLDAVCSESHFFELGGDSLAVLNMSLRVEALTGIVAPHSMVYTSPTAEAYYEALLAEESETVRPFVTAINGGGADAPLFLIPPAVGGISHFQDLLPYLSTGQPTYCLAPRIASNGEHCYDSLKDLARQCLKTIQSIQPQGPYRLMGYSLGGLTCWEIAKQILETGGVVDFVILCDSKGGVAQKNIGKSVGNFIGSYSRHKKWPNPLNIIELSWQSALHAFKSTAARIQQVAEGRSSREGVVGNYGLLDNYEIGQCSANLKLLRSQRQRTLRLELDYELGWYEALKKNSPQVIDIPGNHYEILREPAVASVAKFLKQATDEAKSFRQKQIADEIAQSAQLNKVAFDEPTSGVSLIDRLRTVVHSQPSHTAIRDGGKILSYKELDSMSSQVAKVIVARYGPASEPVVIHLSNSWQFTVAVFAILKSNKFYVALDPSTAAERKRQVFSSLTPRFVISDSSNSDSLSELRDVHGFEMDAIDELFSTFEGAELESLELLDPVPEQTAAIYYTSGSTGQAKGVICSHGMLVHTAWRRSSAAKYSSSDRYMQVYSSSFMGCALATYGALLSGATLCIFRFQQRGIGALANWIIDERITIFHAVTTIYRRFVASLPDAVFQSDLRVIHPGGEQSRSSDLDMFRRCFPESVTYFTSLGSTECGTIALHSVTHTTGNIIGSTSSANIAGAPFPSLDCKIVDEKGGELADGSVGEIVVSSRFILSGYWKGLDHMDAEGGGEDPKVITYSTGDFGYFDEDGLLVYLGRRDSQIKVNGMRADLMEIESALIGLPGVHNAVVCFRRVDELGGEGKSREDKVLIAFYMHSLVGPRPIADTLRASLQQELPLALVPSEFIAMDQLPTKAGGKIDRQFLESVSISSCP